MDSLILKHVFSRLFHPSIHVNLIQAKYQCKVQARAWGRKDSQMSNEKRTHPLWLFFVSLFGAYTKRFPRMLICSHEIRILVHVTSFFLKTPPFGHRDCGTEVYCRVPHIGSKNNQMTGFQHVEHPPSPTTDLQKGGWEEVSTWRIIPGLVTTQPWWS